MSSKNQESYELMEPLAYRMTERGVGLILRGNLETGDFSTAAVTIDKEGATDVVFDSDKALDAYFHPNVTPGLGDLEDVSLNPWDEALDAFGELPQEAKQWALRKVERIARGGKIGPTILLEASKSPNKPKELERAA